MPMVLMSGVTAAIAVSEDLEIGDPRSGRVDAVESEEPMLVG